MLTFVMNAILFILLFMIFQAVKEVAAALRGQTDLVDELAAKILYKAPDGTWTSLGGAVEQAIEKIKESADD